MRRHSRQAVRSSRFFPSKWHDSRRRWHFLLPLFADGCCLGDQRTLPSWYNRNAILVEQPAVPEKYVVSNIDNDIQRQLDQHTQQILKPTRLLQIIDRLHLLRGRPHRTTPGRSGEKMRKDIEMNYLAGTTANSLAIYYLGISATTRGRRSRRPAN